jgi:hypothetical protein
VFSDPKIELDFYKELLFWNLKIANHERMDTSLLAVFGEKPDMNLDSEAFIKWNELGILPVKNLVSSGKMHFTTDRELVIRKNYGDTYTGQVKGEIIDGIGRQVYQNGAIYEGEFKNGKFDGFGRYIWNDGGYYEGNWKEGKKHGEGK